jgi:hypothetical protein
MSLPSLSLAPFSLSSFSLSWASWERGKTSPLLPLFLPFSSFSFCFLSLLLLSLGSGWVRGLFFSPLLLSLSLFLQLSFTLSCAFCSGQGGDHLLLPFFFLSSSLSPHDLSFPLSPSLSLSLVFHESREQAPYFIATLLLLGGNPHEVAAYIFSPSFSLSHTHLSPLTLSLPHLVLLLSHFSLILSHMLHSHLPCEGVADACRAWLHVKAKLSCEG